MDFRKPFSKRWLYWLLPLLWLVLVLQGYLFGCFQPRVRTLQVMQDRDWLDRLLVTGLFGFLGTLTVVCWVRWAGGASKRWLYWLLPLILLVCLLQGHLWSRVLPVLWKVQVVRGWSWIDRLCTLLMFLTLGLVVASVLLLRGRTQSGRAPH